MMQSKRLIVVLALVVVFLSVLPLTAALASSSVSDNSTTGNQTETVGPNLLTNPGMDGKFVKQCSARNGAPWIQVPCPANYSDEVAVIKQWETVQVPYGWSAWWLPPNENLNDPNYFNTYPSLCPNWGPSNCIAWHNPEYRDTLGGPQRTGPSRKLAGDNSQKYFTFYSVHEAGMYQVVGGVKPGSRLRFTINQMAWSNGANDPDHSDLGQRMNLQVGIDPTGGNNPWSSNITWSAPAESFDRFSPFVIEAVAKNKIVSVWTRSRPVMPLQHNDVYVDEGSLVVVQGGSSVKTAPSRITKIITSTRIITTTRLITGTDGIVYTALITKSVIYTRTVSVPVTPSATTTSSTKPVTSTKSTKPVTSTTPTKPVSGTLPIPASGTYTVVRGDTLIAIARRFGITPWWRLAELNDLQEPYRIEPGQVLKLK